jgi:hypothetical protein
MSGTGLEVNAAASTAKGHCAMPRPTRYSSAAGSRVLMAMNPSMTVITATARV